MFTSEPQPQSLSPCSSTRWCSVKDATNYLSKSLASLVGICGAFYFPVCFRPLPIQRPQMDNYGKRYVWGAGRAPRNNNGPLVSVYFFYQQWFLLTKENNGSYSPKKTKAHSGMWLFKICWNLPISLNLFPCVLPSHFYHLPSPSTFILSHFQLPMVLLIHREWVLTWNKWNFSLFSF